MIKRITAIRTAINIAILSNFLIIDNTKPNAKNPTITFANSGKPVRYSNKFSIILAQIEVV